MFCVFYTRLNLFLWRMKWIYTILCLQLHVQIYTTIFTHTQMWMKIIDLHMRCIYNFWNTCNNYPIDILKTIYTHNIGKNLNFFWVVELNIINPNLKIKLGCPKGSFKNIMLESLRGFILEGEGISAGDRSSLARIHTDNFDSCQLCQVRPTVSILTMMQPNVMLI